MTAPAVLQPARMQVPLVLDGGRLRAARRRAGLSLDHVGAHIGRDRTHVAKYERGVIDVPGRIIGALAALYGVAPGDFYRPGPAAATVCP